MLRLADAAPAGLFGGVVRVGGFAAQHAARAEHLLELGILRIRSALGLLLGVEVVEVAEELVKSVNGREIPIQVFQMVFPELPSRVALSLQELGHGHVAVL